MTTNSSKIIWTKTDEAPMLASYSLLPIIQAYTQGTGISVESRNISLSGRILSSFPENLTEAQQVSDELTSLGEWTKFTDANIIKLPNISASVPQLKSAIAELQSHGYDIPDYPEVPQNDTETEIHSRYAKVLGSAVNPVLREGNSDRRAAAAVKNYAKQHPHSMGAWSPDSKSHVSTMNGGDFFANEKSTIIAETTTAKIKFVASNGQTTVLKDNLLLEKAEVVDATFMSKNALVTFLEQQIREAKEQRVLFSLHLKATMMKVSDPIIFGHCVKAFYAPVIKKHAETIAELAVNFNNGIGDLYSKLESDNKISVEKKTEIEADIQALYADHPDLAMVNSDRGITNLHVPSDVIIDASMPAAIRTSGQMWGTDGNLHDTKFIIPDSSYAPLYSATIENCINHGALDPTTLGTVQNVGLMAKKAEEYGSHPTTFEAPGNGIIQIVDEKGQTLHEHKVEEGDIWRMSAVKDAPIQDWVKLAVSRARTTGWPAVFWLDQERAHGREMIKKVKAYLEDHDTQGLELPIMSVYEAAKYSIERARAGQDTISVTGNVLRDFNTDLYPIIELGTSAKMLSIVPLMKGGGLFETGAGGSAPKHVQQFVKEAHLRWDSLGEFLALAESLDHLARTENNAKAAVLAKALNQANEQFLSHNKSPSRIVHELDNRGSHFYLAMYWAQALAQQTEDSEIQNRFTGLAQELEQNELIIVAELNAAQGKAVDLGGYFDPDDDKTAAAMRPSSTFNSALSQFCS
ncbi:MAG: NADP-dependent isocitrate dehydrogenase [SAR324 cluster bacterium]|nr:NADP-dependent isocitrate dehydrogenase [SAR324 cluster bacterium]MBL7034626.1 NADP-dependent isocitrate dehydrogenase [SAR324 cluster bacterium]